MVTGLNRALVTTSVIVMAGCSAPVADSLGPVERMVVERVIGQLNRKIADEYVVREEVESLNRQLNAKLAAGEYDGGSYSDLATQLTLDLQDWSGDLHFRVWHVGELPPLAPGTVVAGFASNSAQPGLEMLDGNIAHLRNVRKISDRHKKLYSVAMNDAAAASGLIIDIRECSGGDREAVRFLASYFFEPPFLLYSEEETGNNLEPVRVLERIEGGRLPDIPLCILTSKSTASGGEALAYLLQQHERATVIGETTTGAAHAVKTYDLSDDFRAFIPRFRTIHPKTGTDWEGTGVVPDIQVPAEHALEEACRYLTGKND